MFCKGGAGDFAQGFFSQRVQVVYSGGVAEMRGKASCKRFSGRGTHDMALGYTCKALMFDVFFVGLVVP